jgi:hypothetical protein
LDAATRRPEPPFVRDLVEQDVKTRAAQLDQQFCGARFGLAGGGTLTPGNFADIVVSARRPEGISARSGEWTFRGPGMRIDGRTRRGGASRVNQMEFANKSVIVTGGASGIGQTIALEFAGRGAKERVALSTRFRKFGIKTACLRAREQAVVGYVTVFAKPCT